MYILSKGFSKKGFLEDHNNIHSDKKPFKCAVCDKTYSAQPALKG